MDPHHNSDDSLEYVGFWPRVGATIIDALLIFAVTAPLLIAIYGSGYFLDEGPLIHGRADVLISWVFPCIATVACWRTWQATPGKLAVSARVVDAATGRPASVGQLVMRYLAYFPSILAFGLGILWVAFDPRRQGWHDKLAGTVVIRPVRRGPEPVRFGRY